MSGSRSGDAGFTLIETLVALAVLAVGSVTLLVSVERHAAGVRQLSDRVVAHWVAENAIAAARSGIEMQPQWAHALGIDWAVRQDARALPGSGLEAVTVRVADRAAGRDASLVALTGYIAAQQVTP